MGEPVSAADNRIGMASTQDDPATMDQIFKSAVARHQAGHLADAGILYREVLQAQPHHPEANHNLGVVAVQLHKPEAGLPFFIAALEVDPTGRQYWVSYIDALLQAEHVDDARQILAFAQQQGLQGDQVDELITRLDALSSADAEAYFIRGIELKSQGKLEAAADCYRHAVKSNPEFAAAYYNLGNVLKDLGQLDPAAENYRHALRLIPHNAMVHSNLGAVLQEAGRSDEAELSYRRALNVEPNYADAHYNLGITLQTLNRPNEAETCYHRALLIKPDFVDALNSLASLLNQQGNATAALDLIKQSLQINETTAAKRIFVACVKHLVFTQVDSDVLAAMIRALTEPWGRPSDLARTTINLIKLNPDIAACMTRATEAGPRRLSAQELYAANGLRPVAANLLLCALLESTPVCDIALERFLTQARDCLLAAAIEGEGHDAFLNFYCALARQCFINEYVFAYSDDEIQTASHLRDSLTTALAANAPIPDLWLVAVASYFPLHSLTHATQLLDRSWPDAVMHILQQQLREPHEEQQLRATIPKATRVDNNVSLQVQTQYEEHPYPRWVKTAPSADVKPIDAYLRQKFPFATFEHRASHDLTEILVAGCGTGLHPVATAQRIQGARILAVDLSLTSLSYAKRKALEMQLSAIEFAQADLLHLDSLGRHFDVIESSGVLHHLADPWAGWRALLSILRPGGLMKLGFYSELARRHVVRIRDLIAELGCGSTSDAIRLCRQQLMTLSHNADFGTTLQSPDFFSTSACRDLLFHVHEHRMTLNQIRAFLDENKLHLLGFEIESGILRAYQQKFPDDRAATNLEQWQSFENDNPDTFGNMYQFWIQKSC